ncbi:MAG: oligosaccharyl transferase, archaeosortase A system-associated [Halorientalis sp.]
MSQSRGRLSDFELESVIDEVREWYHVPALVVLMSFMLWVRARSWSSFTRNGEVFFAGNDAWYHLRQTTYTVRHWPQTMPFDPWTFFPYGTANSQFGTLFDQLVATAALVVGLGSPSDHTVALTLLFAPAVFGTLVAIPAYLGGRRLGGRFGGVVAVLVLALSTGGFLGRALVGFSDHQIAEAFFQLFAVVGFMTAVGVAESEFPVWELVANREWDALRRSAGWAALAGVALGLYVWTWAPAVLLIGVLGIFLFLQLNLDYLRGASPEPVAFVGAVGLGVAGIMALVPLYSFGFSATNYSLLQPVMAFGLAGGSVVMAWLAREYDDRDLDPRTYPFTVVGIVLVVAGITAVVLPDLFSYILRNIPRLVGLQGGARASTIGEAQPLRAPIRTLFTNFGLTFLSAGVAALAMVVAYLRRSDAPAEWLFVLVWGVIMLLATLTQQRFGYYLALPVALLNAYVVDLLLRYISPGEGLEEVQTFQVLAVLTVLVILVVPLAISPAGSSRPTTAVEIGGANGPQSGTVGWDSALEWMSQNLPQQGTYGGADNPMQKYGTFGQTDNFDYPAGAYGVISWWDYGHWLTTRGDTIPTANPFQQGAGQAANFLLAPNQSQAQDVIAELSEDDATPRYVAIDWKMVNTWGQAGGKFFAPIVFYENESLSQQDFYRRVLEVQGGQARTAYYLHSQRYYESMVNRLWYFHGSAREPQPVVVNYEERQIRGRTILTVPMGNESRYRQFGGLLQSRQQALAQARQFVREDGSAQIGGVGPNPPERVSALEHYRLVRNSDTSALQRTSPYLYTIRRTLSGLAGNLQDHSRREIGRIQREIQSILLPRGASPPWVKIFERVPGAEIQGTGPANTNVTARVRMRAATNNETFIYHQRVQTGPDGRFTMTVPYSTTGYDNWGPQTGHTNVSVKATGQYRFLTPARQNESGAFVRYIANASVTEAQVLGEDETPVEVSLERDVLQTPSDGGGNETATGNTTSGGGDASGGDATGSGNATSDGTTTGNDGGSGADANATASQSHVAGPARIAP